MTMEELYQKRLNRYLTAMPPLETGAVPPGVCRTWEDKRTESPVILGEETQLKKIWNDIEGMGNMFIWHCLLSF